MKNLFILLSLFIVNLAQAAEEIEVPKHMRDGKIVVTLKDGKSYEFSTNEYMVVRRKAKSKPVAVAPVSQVAVEKVKEPKPLNRNRVRLLGSYAPSGFNYSITGDTLTVRSTNGGVVGLGYDRLIGDRFSLGGAILTNGTYLLNAGVDF
jgi:hypothetical protein